MLQATSLHLISRYISVCVFYTLLCHVLIHLSVVIAVISLCNMYRSLLWSDYALYLKMETPSLWNLTDNGKSAMESSVRLPAICTGNCHKNAHVMSLVLHRIMIENTSQSPSVHCCPPIILFYHNGLVERWEGGKHASNDCDKNFLSDNNNFTSLRSICCRNAQKNQRKMFSLFSFVPCIVVTYLFHIYRRLSLSLFPTPTYTLDSTRLTFVIMNSNSRETDGNGVMQMDGTQWLRDNTQSLFIVSHSHAYINWMFTFIYF